MFVVNAIILINSLIFFQVNQLGNIYNYLSSKITLKNKVKIIYTNQIRTHKF